MTTSKGNFDFTMNMFMGMMMLIGLVITIFAFKIAKDVTNCSDKAQNALRGLLVMGVALLCVSSTSLVCGCTKDLSHPAIGKSFTALMVVIGIITITLTSIISSECTPAKGDLSIILILSVIVTVVSAGYLGYEFYNYIEDGKSGHKSVEMSTLAKFNFGKQVGGKLKAG
jgi:hypothetical protein